MLKAIGLGSAEELFDSIPQDLRLQRPLNTPAALSEIELLDRFEQMGARNAGARRVSFMGGGAYSHYVPTIVDHIISRSEFFTAYTPYQPEISQGTLQTIFEFQTLVCQLTGMEVANASMYDGSTGLAEAVLMAERVTKRSKVVASTATHPQYLEVVRTYVQHAGIDLELVQFDEKTGQSWQALAGAIDDATAALVVQSPNFFGCVEDLSALADAVRDVGGVGLLALGVRHHVADEAGAHAELLVDGAHPFRVALRQVVVDRDEVDTGARQRVQVQRHRRDERLSLAGLHLGDVALVENGCAHHLDVEVALAERALGRLSHGGEGFEDQLLERLAVLEPLAKLSGLAGELRVGERLEVGLELADVLRLLAQALEAAALAEAKCLFEASELWHGYRVSVRFRAPDSAFSPPRAAARARPRGRRRRGSPGRRSRRRARHRGVPARWCRRMPGRRPRSACARPGGR